MTARPPGFSGTWVVIIVVANPLRPGHPRGYDEFVRWILNPAPCIPCILHHPVVPWLTAGQPRRDVMMIPATMINRAAPRTAIAISPALYFALGCCVLLG